jgi:hypothetical protein
MASVLRWRTRARKIGPKGLQELQLGMLRKIIRVASIQSIIIGYMDYKCMMLSMKQYHRMRK